MKEDSKVLKNHEKNEKSKIRSEKRFRDILFSFFEFLLGELGFFLWERYLEKKGYPTIRFLEEQNRKLQQKTDLLEKKIQWILIFVIIQTVFLVILVFFLI
ncbi:MAG: hypothetical protein NZ853_09505 [Leptospiraceae bacterium]|nr:hypothetical protein [Leptospiraceae bacterium]MDW7975666.1 hypothetical protein [Leptospiraceae bacterium]